MSTNPVGAQIYWTPERKAEACDYILNQLSTSDLGLNHICGMRQEPRLPNPGTFYEWMDGDVKLAERYARARELQQHYCVDSASVLATQLVARNPSYSIDPAAFRAYFDTVKFRASKLAPKAYGDKVETTLKGDKDNPIQTETTLKGLSLDELRGLAKLGNGSSGV